MKDEFEEKIISEFIGLKSKMYSLIDVDDEEVTKAKGVNKIVVKKIRHKECIGVLFNKNMIRHKMKRIQSILHRIGTYDICKISLSCFDDKIYILDDWLIISQIKLSKINKFDKINNMNKISKIYKISSIVIKAARTELVLFFKLCIKKTKEIKKKKKILCFNSILSCVSLLHI